MGWPGSTKERRSGEIKERKNLVLKEREERGEGEEILKGVWMEGWECVAAQ